MGAAVTHTETTGTPGFHLGYRPALDGLRGFSILAVMGIHADHDVVPGGHLGVQVFFVLSGFLITALLLGERQASGTISLKNFYARRALRLLPAIVAVVIAGAIYAALFPDRIGTQDYVRDALATLFYVANWLYAIVGIQDHVLVHTWSLSIEEQFYLVWPLVTVLILRRRASYPVLLAVCVGGAALSATLRLALFLAGASADRMYFGLDTRADALLVGCALGVIAAWGRLPTGELARRLGTVCAYVGAGILVVAIFKTTRKGPILYRGGFTVIALCTAAMIAHVVMVPNGLAARVLSIKPMVWLGRVSYGLYLWHLPVYAVFSEADMPVSRPVELVLETVVSLGIAAVSFYFLEQPFLRLKDRFARPDADVRSTLDEPNLAAYPAV